MSQFHLRSGCEGKRARSSGTLQRSACGAALGIACALTANTSPAQTEPPPVPPPVTAAPAPEPPPPAPPPPATPPPPQSPPPAAAPPSPPPYDPSMQAGGLAPPPPMTQPPPQPPPQGNTEQQLDEAKEKDSERGLKWVWLNVGGGYQHVGLQTFSIDVENFTAGFIPSSADGGVVSAGVGARLLFLTIGARGRVGFFPAWQVFSIGGELGFRFPLGRLEPYFDLGAGYTALGSFKEATSLQQVTDAISIRGLDARFNAGLDFFVTPIFSIGAAVGWEFLALTRPGVAPDQIAQIKANNPSLSDAEKLRADALELEGSSYGSAFSAMGMLGLHFP